MKHGVSALLAMPLAALLAGIHVAGCTTTSFAGLARTGYVDQVNASAQATQKDLAGLQGQVDDMKKVSGRMQELAAQMEQTQKATADLQQLARQVQDRLAELPRETLEMLVKSIQEYLAK
jgi:ABC-type transporter Mla subunit MlaD